MKIIQSLQNLLVTPYSLGGFAKLLLIVLVVWGTHCYCTMDYLAVEGSIRQVINEAKSVFCL